MSGGAQRRDRAPLLIAPWVMAPLVLGAILVQGPSEARAQQSVEALFEAANAAAYRGEYEDAVEGYRRLVALDVQDPDVYYNLGVSHARLGQHGRAIAAFERALWLRPGDEDAEGALAATRETLASGRAEREGEATMVEGVSLIESLGKPFTEFTLASAFLIFDVLAFLTLFGLLRARRESMRIAFGVALPIAVLLFIASGVALMGRTHPFDDSIPAIVVVDSAEILAGPDERAERVGTAREGDRVRILAPHRDFREVRLPGGKRGWLAADTITTVEPGVVLD